MCVRTVLYRCKPLQCRFPPIYFDFALQIAKTTIVAPFTAVVGLKNISETVVPRVNELRLPIMVFSNTVIILNARAADRPAIPFDTVSIRHRTMQAGGSLRNRSLGRQSVMSY